MNYRVRSGDTLGALANRFDTSVTALARQNRIANPNLIRVGQVLTVPDRFEARPPVPTVDLKRGMQGPAVQQLQQDLVKLGYMTRAQMATGPGIFGERTEAAVKSFQARHGVPATGYYGPQTRAALSRALGNAGPTTPTTTPTTTPASSSSPAAKPAVIRAPSPNYDSRNGRDIDTIVLHHTASNNGAGDLAWLRSPRSQVSAHYMVDRNGRIYQLVGDDKRAWHAGESALHGVPSDVNARSLGIEIVNDGSGRTRFTDAQYRSLGKLVKYLKQRYNVPMGNIVGHKDVAVPRGRKNDPARNFDWARLRASVR